MMEKTGTNEQILGRLLSPSLYCRYLIERHEEGDIERAMDMIVTNNLSRKEPDLSVLVARAYRDGKGVEKDYGKAIQILMDLNKNGIHAYDMELVDLIYKRNKKQDYEKAFLMLVEMTSGNPEAYGKLARAYRDGKGVEKNIEKSIDLYKYAAEHKINWARNELFDMLYVSDDEVDQREAVKIISVTADKKDRFALIRLGKAYRDGRGIEKDLNKAMECFKISYDAGIQNAGIEIVKILMLRSDGEDLKDAYNLLNELASKGNADAMNLIGEMYRDGLYVKRDSKKALEWFDRASSSGGL